MKSIYVDPSHWATISLIELHDVNAWLITGVEVNRRFRGRGHAADLMDRVCDDADNEGTSLILDVNPDGTGLDFDMLVRFYSSRGFEPWEEAPTGMIRRPRED